MDFLDSQRRPVKETDRTAGPYPYYGANGLQGWIDGFIFDEPLLLLAEDGGHFDDPDRGVAYRIEGKSWVNNHAHVLRPKPFMDIRFLCRVLENYDLRPFITGSTRAKLTKKDAERIVIPVPPLDEQRRIAAILDQADDLRRKRREAIAKLAKLSTGLFVELFGTPWISSASSSISDLGSISVFENGDRSSNYPSGDDILSSGIPFLSTKNIVDDKLDLGSLLFISSSKFASLSRGKARPHDLIITLRGTLGSCCIFDGPFSTAFINAQMMIIRPKTDISPVFLHAYLTLPAIKEHLQQIGNGAAVPQLTAKQLAGLPILHPSPSNAPSPPASPRSTSSKPITAPISRGSTLCSPRCNIAPSAATSPPLPSPACARLSGE
ncbi:restriction endonuclease subunit S [Methylosinus trichosporium]|uniref:restriction endonuclease subunit S n=1 Tax=Methylosinus trichosporium TaxID=426 RepID=UPI00138AEA4A|nr:restriction endonuclease subunit S [Methylosinus trichosporium]